MELTTADLITKLTQFGVDLWNMLGYFCTLVLTKDIFEVINEVGAFFGSEGLAKFVSTILQGVTGGLLEDVPLIVFLLINAVLLWISVEVLKVLISILKLFII